MGIKLLYVTLITAQYNMSVVYFASLATIVVLYNAGPLDVSWAVDSNKVVAILESFFPAQVSSVVVDSYCIHN